jgi:hypothetical protein
MNYLKLRTSFGHDRCSQRHHGRAGAQQKQGFFVFSAKQRPVLCQSREMKAHASRRDLLLLRLQTSEEEPRMRRSNISCLVGLFLVAASGTARADCVSACQASTYCDSEMNASGECGRRLNDCYIDQCNRKIYGAIAYGAKSGAFGWSNDLGDAQSAENQALNNCSANGDDCQVTVDFWNSCAAVAASRATVAYGLGDNRGQAEGDAVAACEKDGGAQCEVKAWACTGP